MVSKKKMSEIKFQLVSVLKTNKVECIQFDSYPTEHAMKAFENGYYFEAVFVLHGFMHAKMLELFYLSCHKSLVKTEDFEEVLSRLSFDGISAVLYMRKRMSKKEYLVLKKLNQLRNKLAHEYFYEDGYRKLEIKTNDLKTLFSNALKLCEKIEYRSDKRV